ncbi:dioxygenase [Ferrigenium kumadai]|uniref:Dioxygenase n=1 Tax=Ferrigenium kumadai TaxID=1682490 RepID=A0AAN1T1I8_9PROT|nr:dioxygenase [Ferrigenium kumadai]
MMPVLFLSHGAPTLPLDAGETGAAWRRLGERLPKPSSILMISAHWETSVPTVSRAVRPETIHDFSGFPAELYQLRYPAPGAPEMARAAVAALQQAGISAQLDESHGLDHGAWVPLSFLFPQANVPVAQLSIQPGMGPAWHVALGRALRPLREQGILIVGSGAITHNLRAIFRHPQDEPAPAWVTEFRDWVASRIREGDLQALLDYRSGAPHAAQNHPTDEHLLPLFVALGAADDISSAQHLNAVMTFGLLAMDAWLFDAPVE